MNQEEVAKRAEELIAGLSAIPITELIDCARGNLKATRLTRLSKDHPDGKEEPDFNVRQKALEWIGSMIGASPTTPRRAEAKRKDAKDIQQIGGIRKAGRPKSPV